MAGDGEILRDLAHWDDILKNRKDLSSIIVSSSNKGHVVGVKAQDPVPVIVLLVRPKLGAVVEIPNSDGLVLAVGDNQVQTGVEHDATHVV